MKSTGITRPLDQLGRVVLPIELRRVLDLPEGTPMEIYVDGDKIILHKYEDKCEFCGNTDDITEFKDKAVCKDCIESLRNFRLPY